jgi:hypothetical protein
MGAGIAHDDASVRPADAPTIPSLECNFERFPPLQAGHEGARSAVTNASNGLSQSRHRYSYKGIA